MSQQILALACFALAVAVMTSGAAVAWSARNLAKRIFALMIAMTGSALALAALGAPPSAILAGAAVSFAHLLVGLGLLVRAHEHYGSAELSDIDVADAQREPVEPKA